jgi:putative ABC transport system permease protein
MACVNASSLLVARVTGRRRELAIRVALGASRARVTRHLLAESALLALGAAVAGVTLAWLAVSLLRSAAVADVPRAQEIVLSGRTLLVLIGLTVSSAFLFGLVPAVHATGGALDEALRSSGRGSTGTRAVRRLRAVLVGCQFAVATPLLVIAALVLISLDRLASVDVGFDTHGVLTGAVMLPPVQYRDAARIVTFWERLRAEVAALPGVTAVAFTTGRPPLEAGEQNDFMLEDPPAGADPSRQVATWVRVTPEYLPLLGLRVVEGRLWDERDRDPASGNTIVVDEAWARRFVPGRSAVGRRLKLFG